MLSTVLNSTNLRFAYLDTNYNYTFVNPAFASNCRKGAAELVGLNHFQLFPHPGVRKLFLHVTNTGEPVSFVDEPLTSEADVCWDGSLVPVKDAQGHVIGLVLSMAEATPRKQAEAALVKNEDKFRRIFETANEGIWLLNHEARVTMSNQRMAEMLGYRVDELVGRFHSDFVCSEDAALLQELMIRRRKGLPDQADIRFRSKQGDLVWLLLCGRPLFDSEGKFSGALDMFTDITERKRAEARLDLLAETASQLLRSHEPQHVVNSLCQKVMSFLDCQVFFNFLVDRDKNCLHLNACGGISTEQARAIEWLEFGVAVCGCAARDGCRIVAEDVQHRTDSTTALVRSMGVQGYACHPLRVQDRVLGTLSFGTTSRSSFAADELSLMKAVADLVAIAMERKHAQYELQKVNAELEHRVEERTKSLQELTEQLNAFCHTLAHDLRAPLRTQLSFARLLLDDCGDRLGNTGKDWAERVLRSAERQSHIIQDLMAYITVSRDQAELSALSLEAAVEQAKADLRLELEQKSVAIESQDLADCEILANSSFLHLVLLNLITNAIKFVPPGTTPEIRISAQTSGEFVRLCVEDNGIGIKESDLSRLFSEFQRLQRGPEYPGTGLGLSIVKKAVERMGGRVGVQSEPGHGSRFWIELRHTQAHEARVGT